MTRQLLRRGNIRTSVEKIANKAAAKIVRRKRRHARLDCALLQNVEYRLVGQAANGDSATFVNAAKEWPGITTTGNKPLFQASADPLVA